MTNVACIVELIQASSSEADLVSSRNKGSGYTVLVFTFNQTNLGQALSFDNLRVHYAHGFTFTLRKSCVM